MSGTVGYYLRFCFSGVKTWRSERTENTACEVILKSSAFFKLGKLTTQPNGTDSEMTPSDMVIKFLLDNNIQRGVVEEILERGFDSLQALDTQDIKSQKISVGQRRLLLHIAKSLGANVTRTSSLAGADSVMPTAPTSSLNQLPASTTSANQPSPVSGNNEQPDVYHQTLLNTLVSQQAQLATNQTSSMNKDSNSAGNLGNIVNQTNSVQPSWHDPQKHIATATGKSIFQHYDICDFVPHTVDEELVIGGQGDQQVVVKSGPKKPKLTVSQWSIANMAIIYKLVGEGRLAGSALMDYLSYTTKVYQLVQKCNLTSVLLYDREYRQLQANMGFRCGTDVQHLHTLHLQSRDRQRKPRAQSQLPEKCGGSNHNQQPKSKADNREMGICKMFNSEKGCTFPKCRYLHQCVLPGCGQSHSGTTHATKN